MKVTAIFDIGKTNKKFFLFDEQFNEVYRDYVRFEEAADEDGFPCENLDRLTSWMKETFLDAQSKSEFDIRRLNFSTYGASFVHLDKQGRPLTPLYNYLKPFPEGLLDAFYDRYGPAGEWATQTASPVMGMLNSGLQLYWLKKERTDIFQQIHRSLHFPQYCACLFTGQFFNEYTSIGCHTGLWDFKKEDYHQWVFEEKLDRLFPPIQNTTAFVEASLHGKLIKTGIGIHDSSAALLPYLRSNQEAFLLVSTGTWSITLNPFSAQHLSEEDLDHDCLNYMQVDGRVVRAARFFLGNEYKIWGNRLADHFGIPYETHRTVQPRPELIRRIAQKKKKIFHWESIRKPGIPPAKKGTTRIEQFSSYEEAYHQLLYELTDEQTACIQLARGNTPVKKIYVDGGFIDNALFIKLLNDRLPEYELIITASPLGSALGATMAISNLQPTTDNG